MKLVRLLDLGRRPYRDVWDLQRDLHARVAGGEAPESWIVVEHTPVVTLGRNAKASNLNFSPESLAGRGIDVFSVERGGDVTYHGPGQLVVYPIRKLERFREIVPLVRALEAAVIQTCASFGVASERWSDHAGVWIGANQICAIGLAIKKMTSLHGIALNVSTDLNYDRLITPCGLPNRGITSLTKEARAPIELTVAKNALLESLEREFGIRFSSSASGLELAS
ncbi:MAG: lipoyl(octanoyl) transferase LipB [Candidatus Eremiobacteraeota bacterium]|nr:lipoyl(octanoyl) transferase LipB [Candidatus Eremiobacteraeota bacterium]